MNRLFRPLLAAFLFLLATAPALAATKDEIDAGVKEALAKLYEQSSAAKDLGAKAVGILVFPKVVKGGVGVGGEFGDGHGRRTVAPCREAPMKRRMTRA